MPLNALHHLIVNPVRLRWRYHAVFNYHHHATSSV